MERGACGMHHGALVVRFGVLAVEPERALESGARQRLELFGEGRAIDETAGLPLLERRAFVDVALHGGIRDRGDPPQRHLRPGRAARLRSGVRGAPWTVGLALAWR